MNQQEIREIMSGRRSGVLPIAMRAALALASVPYSAAMRIRRWAYRRGLLPSEATAVPVISVGNITTGGTGKTPMVAWLAEHLKQAGRKPAILTRGYKAHGGESDEAAMLRQTCNVDVVVNPDRIAGAAAAVAKGADVLIMDDGFQHRRLRRDLDIVLIDTTNPFGYEHVLPRGMLREAPDALKDANAIIITRSDIVSPAELSALRERLGRLAPQASIHKAVHSPKHIIDEDGRSLPLSAIAGKKVCAFCGVGNPDDFFRTLEKLNAAIVSKEAFDDHARYDVAMLEKIFDLAGDWETVITTQKDFARLASVSLDRAVWRLAIEFVITGGLDSLKAKIEKILKPVV